MTAANCSLQLPSCSLSLPRTCPVSLVVSLFRQKPPGFSTGSTTSDQVHRTVLFLASRTPNRPAQDTDYTVLYPEWERGRPWCLYIHCSGQHLPRSPWPAVAIYWEGVWVIMCLQNQRIQWTHPDNSQGIRHWFSSWTTELKTSLSNNLVNNF